MPIYKFLGNIFLTSIQNLILGSNLSEFHTGYRAYSPKKLNKIPFTCNSNSFVFDTEILIQLIMNNFKIFEIPVKTTYSTQISNLKVIPYGLSVINAVIQSKLCKFGLIKNNKYSKKQNNLSQRKKLTNDLEEGFKNTKKKMFNYDNFQKPN